MVGGGVRFGAGGLGGLMADGKGSFMVGLWSWVGR